MTTAAPITQPAAKPTASTQGTPSRDSAICLTSHDIALANQSYRMRRFRSLQELCFALVNSLCNQFHCEQVGVGMVRHTGVQILAISGCIQLKRGSPGVVDMRQAMEECMDEGGPIGYPAASGATSFAIHRQWSVACNGSHVCSLPLQVDDQVVAVVSLRRPAKLPLTDEVLEQLSMTLLPFGPLLSLMERANQPLARHLLASSERWLERLRSKRRALQLGLFFFVAAVLLVGKTTYRPLCDAVVEAVELRHMTAPLEAQLKEVHIQAGELVKQGAILAEFDTHQRQLELATIQAEAARTEVNARAAVESGDVSAAALQKAHIRVLMARQAALIRRIQSAQLVAPADGMVIQSHVDKRLGQVFSQGDPVLEFAPNDGWRILIHIPESVAIHVKPGQVGSFASAARPHDKVTFRLTQMDGSADVVDDDNVFLARADLQTSPAWMRSGMQGIAQVDTVKRPLWWVTFHRFIDWTRLRFWL